MILKKKGEHMKAYFQEYYIHLSTKFKNTDIFEMKAMTILLTRIIFE